MKHKKLLIDGANQMGIELSEKQIKRLLEYLTLLIQWNKTYNLTAIRAVEEGVGKHLLDSLSILPYVKPQSLLDVGSGAGLPGIVIGIMRPNLAVTVLDCVAKKCHFMRFAKTQLKLNNLSVVNMRVEKYQVQTGFQQVVSRAFSEIGKTLKLTQHLLCDNGRYLLMKGANVSQEQLPKEAKIHQLSVPGVSDKRFLIEIQT